MAELRFERQSIQYFLKERDKHFEFIFNGKERNDCKEQNIILGQQKLILSKEKKLILWLKVPRN